MLMELLALLVTYLVVLLVKIYFQQQHWQKLGILVPGYQFPLGNNPFFDFDSKLNRKHYLIKTREQYDEVKGKARFYGCYQFGQRFLIIIDPDLAKDIMVKNFHCFVDRQADNSATFILNNGTLADEINVRQFVVMKGDQWKEARSAFSPIFTSGKMKTMFPLLKGTSDKLMESLEADVKDNKTIELKSFLGKFSMDTIASCAFGVDAKSFDTEESDFVRHAKNVFRFKAREILKFFALVLVPGMGAIFKWLRITITKTKEILFFYGVIKSTMEYRSKTKTRRNDLVDMMLDVIKSDDDSTAANGDNEDDDDDDQYHKDAKLNHHSNNGKKKSLDELVVVGSAYNLLSAGYDTTSLVLSFLGHKLALNPEIQRRIQDEVDEVLDGNDIPTYDSLVQMEYLDAAIHETLRIHPPLPLIQRGCTADYKIPGTDIWIRKGDEVFINVAGLHSDPEYYPDPETFNPDNFTREAKERRHPYTFHGFGQGPRNCMGMRFALMEAKMGMARILSKYSFVKCSETPDKLTLDPASILGSSKEELFVKLQPRGVSEQ